MTMAKTLSVSTAILSLVAVSSCGSNPSNGDAGAGAGGKGGTTGVGGQAGTSAGGRGGGSAGASGSGGTAGVAGNSGGAGTTAGRGGDGGSTAGAGGGVAGRGGTGGVAGNGAGGRGGVGGSAGNAGRGGMGGGGGGESCGGQICGQDEFCCGPPACGNCRNILTGPNCPTSCGGAGGNAGQGGRGGQGGADCTVTGCPTGQVCYSRSAGVAIVSIECVDDPCAPAPLACACAESTLTACAQLCTVTGRNITCGSRCAAPDTPISTPSGEQPIATLRPGDLVYSMHRGRLLALPVVRTTRTPATRHQVVRVRLDTGRVLHISPGHPTADGGTFAGLRAGAQLGERRVVAVEIVPYLHAFTYDVLPNSDTGTYLAAGALVGSTLAQATASSASEHQ
jgi:hypothetical protein